MKKLKKILLKALKWIGITLASLLVLVIAVRIIGQIGYRKVPDGGINESMYVDINGTKQWISIYGQDVDNPVLLYLHGGPGSATSYYDYKYTRKWADVYTVVTWDQRNCGKSYSKDQNDTVLTYDLFMEDGLEMTEFIRDYLGKDKITILGHSWGTYYGCNLVLAHPEYYDCYIGTGQLVDDVKNEEAFLEAASKWVEENPKGIGYYNQMTAAKPLSIEYYNAKNALMYEYGYGMFSYGQDFNMYDALFYNPYYSVFDYIKLYFMSNFTPYDNFISSGEFNKFSLLDKKQYEVPFYNINGDKDYQTNHVLAEEYFNEIEAPRKELIIMNNMTHGLLEARSSEFSKIVHDIARKEKEAEE